MGTSVYCLADTTDQASTIVDRLRSEGFSSNDISVLFADQTTSKDFAYVKHTKAPEGVAIGASAGGIIGGALGWLTGIGSLVVPGVGPFVAAGPIMAMLSGAAVGAAVGGVSGALIGVGIPEYEAKRYEGKIREGAVLISVHARDGDQIFRAKRIYEACWAHDIATSSEAAVTSGAAGSSGSGAFP